MSGFGDGDFGDGTFGDAGTDTIELPGGSGSNIGDPADREYLYRGLRFGHCTDCDNDTHVEVVGVDGLEGTSQRDHDLLLPDGHGAVSGPHWANPRTIIFDLKVHVQDRTLMEESLAALVAISQVISDPDGGQPLIWQHTGMPYEVQVSARPVAFAPGRLPGKAGDWIATPRLALKAADPRITSTDLTVLAMSPLAAGTGLDFPLDFPLDFGASVGVSEFVNDGTWPSAPVIRVYGPTSGTMTGGTLTNVTTGVSVTWGTDLAAGQVLTMDMAVVVSPTGAAAVYRENGSDQYGSWSTPRTPFLLAPGSNVLQFVGTGTVTGVVLTVTAPVATFL